LRARYRLTEAAREEASVLLSLLLKPRTVGVVVGA
jgi:hypothetical protein